MTKQLTKAQLAAQLEASHVAYQRLEAECIALRAASVQSRAQSARSDAVAGTYRAALNAAREMAMRTGRSVRVG
jgi:hypothetical protein